MPEPRREAARAFEALGRSIKRISNYRHARDKFGEFLQPAHAELSALLAREPQITVDVEPAALSIGGEPVLSEPQRDVSLCYRLHRDGVRKLTFQRGLTAEELLAFARIAMPDSIEGGEAGREDALIELWKADLAHVSYEAIAMFEVASTEADRAALAEATLRAQGALQGQGGLNAALEDAQGVVAPLVRDDERASIDASAGEQRLRRAALVILRIVERRLAGRDIGSLAETLGRLTDEMLRQGDAGALGALLEKLAQSDTAFQPLRDALSRRLAESWRLTRLAGMCEGSMDLFMFGLPVYLQLLPYEAGTALVQAMSSIDAKGVREAFGAAAAARLAACRPAYEAGLARGPAGVARALLQAAEGIEASQRGPLAALALGHPDLTVQIDAVKTLAVLEPKLAVQLLGPNLTAVEPSVRVAAAEALGTIRLEEAGQVLLQRMRALEFARAERAEREVFFEALGRGRSQLGFGFLCERLTQRGAAQKKGAVEDQVLAVRGLAAEGTARSLRVLEHAALPEQGHQPVVVQSCKSAANHVRELLARGEGQ